MRPTHQKVFRVDQTAKSPRFPHEDVFDSSTGCGWCKYVENACVALAANPFLRPAFPTDLHYNHNNHLFLLQKRKGSKTSCIVRG
jgi:hypothetical protein